MWKKRERKVEYEDEAGDGVGRKLREVGREGRREEEKGDVKWRRRRWKI